MGGEKSNRGRHTEYSPELAVKICDEIKDGKSEAMIAEGLGLTERTFTRWKDKYPDFCLLSAHARALAADKYNKAREDKAKRLVELAEQAAQTGEAIPKGVVDAYRVAIQEDARSAALRDDSRYGDRKHIALGGEKDAPPVRVDLSGVSTENLRKIRELLTDARSNAESD
jgi:hypothetical protein